MADRLGIINEDTQSGDNVNPLRGPLRPTNIRVKVDGSAVNRSIIGQQVNFNMLSQSNISTEDLNHFFDKTMSSLRKLYKTEETLLDPLPWEKQMRLYPEENVVNLDMLITSRSGRFISTQSYNELSDLLNPIPSQGNDVPCHVLICGEPGFGKSTICSKIAYDWAKKAQTFSAYPCDKTLLILYRLKNLPPGRSLERELIRMIHSHSPRSCDVVTSYTENALRNYKGNLLIVLDGHDELRLGNENKVEDLLKSRKDGPQSCLRDAVIVLTSRLDIKISMYTLFDRLFLMKGMSYKNCQTFIKKLFPDDTDKLILHQLDMLKLEQLPPIAILMVCYLHKNQNLTLLNNTEELFLQVIFLMAKRCNERDEFGFKEQDIWDKLHFLGKFFLTRLMSNQVIIPDSDITEFFQEDTEDCRFVLKSGILKRSNTTSLSGQSFEPVHRLLLECLALWYLNKHWSSLNGVTERSRFLRDVGLSESVHLGVTLSRISDQKVLFTLEVGSQGNHESHFFLNWNASKQPGENRFTLFDIGLWSSAHDSRVGIFFQKCNPSSKSTGTIMELLTKAIPNVSGLEKLLPILENLPQSVYRFRFRGIFEFNNETSESTSQKKPEISLMNSVQTREEPGPQLHTLHSLVCYLTEESNVKKIMSNWLGIALCVSILGFPDTDFIHEYLSLLIRMLKRCFKRYKIIMIFYYRNEDSISSRSFETDEVLLKDSTFFENVKAYDIYVSFGYGQ